MKRFEGASESKCGAAASRFNKERSDTGSNGFSIEPPVQRKTNNTGLPNQLKSGIENLSGHAMDDVKVHYNSSKPAQLNAHAYAQGNKIHVAPGQQKHLPHEAWHVVQQKQGRVKPTKQMKGKVNVNENDGLEREADTMGAKAHNGTDSLQRKQTHQHFTNPTVQRKIKVSDVEYGAQDGNMAELIASLDIEVGYSEERLKAAGISIDQVLTRFDFQNKRFAHKRDLILAVRKELKKDLGVEHPGIDHLVPVHPLAPDGAVTMTPVLALLKEKDPTGNLRNLILEDTEAAREVMDIYRANTVHPVSDTILFKSMLATLELHESGATYHSHFSAKDQELLTYVLNAYDEGKIQEMIADYGLDSYEHNAVIAYSFPNKDKLFVAGRWNPHYMGYSITNWGHYGDGWTALDGAMRKLPSLGQLRLNVTSYRASRNSDESDKLEHTDIDSHIIHGKHVLGQEQAHYTSAALTYNVHNTADRINKAKGLMAIHGGSGVLINPFGGQGFLDGAEILFPPEMVTRLVAKKKRAFSTATFSAPVYHLQQVTPDPTGQTPMVDDFNFKKHGSVLREQELRNQERIKALISQIQQFSKILNNGKEQAIGMGDMSIVKLTALKKRLFAIIEANATHPTLIQNYEKLILINKLSAMPIEKKIQLEVFLGDISIWGHSLDSLKDYATHFGVY